MKRVNRCFASDNSVGVHPKIFEAMKSANEGGMFSYGDDPYTQRTLLKFKEVFGKASEAYLVYNGTAANILSIAAMTKPFNSIICGETSHLNVDECGGTEKFAGCKLVTIPASKEGKLTPEEIIKHLHGFGDVHHSQPKVISITQATEVGTVYTQQEIKQIADLAHKNNMFLHVDGARFANATATLGLNLKQMSADLGVDVLSFGGTKNGMMFGESIVFFRKELEEDFGFIRKQAMQLHSKMRFISVQFETLLTNNLWLLNAKNANTMAKYLEKRIRGEIPQIIITQKVEANAVFAIVPRELILKLQKEYLFYVWNQQINEVRWMCTFQTTKADIDEFVETIKKLI
ncbi:MAG: low specificity L-threonine aldolase [Candidatus Micrarchaeota archaeon]|mgnify:CR=1 FL=1